MHAKEVTSSEDMLGVVRHHRKALDALDDKWVVDDALLRSLCGPTAEQRACAQIMAELPSADRRCTIVDAKQRLEVLSASEAFRLAPDAVRAGLKFVLQKLQQLHLGLPLDVKLESMSQLARDCVVLFAHFLVRPSAAEKGKFVSGYAAFKTLLKGIEDDLAAAAPVPQQDFQDLCLFRFLAQSDNSARMETAIEALQTAQPAEKKAKKASASEASSSTCAPSASASTAAKDRATRSKAAAMAYFS